jgi:uncharacterized membrane protein YfcA
LSASSVVAEHGFPLWSSGVIVTLMLAVFFLPGMTPAWRSATASGLLLSGVISITGFYILRRASNAPPMSFIKLVLGGMIGRLFGGLGALAAGIAWLKLESMPLSVAFLGSYAVLSIFEYRALFRRLTIKEQA